MSQRFPPIPLDSSNPLGSSFEAEVRKHHGANPSFKYKDENGAPIGPFAVLSYSPDIFPPFMAVGDAVLNQPNVTARARELAILAVCSTSTIPFVSYAHSKIASSVGLSIEQVAAARSGVLPEGLAEDEEATVMLALALAGSKDVLEESVWERSVGILGREGVARIAHIVGVYLYSGALLRVGAIEAPAGS